jgi:hypothetical protein
MSLEKPSAPDSWEPIIVPEHLRGSNPENSGKIDIPKDMQEWAKQQDQEHPDTAREPEPTRSHVPPHELIPAHRDWDEERGGEIVDVDDEAVLLPEESAAETRRSVESSEGRASSPEISGVRPRPPMEEQVIRVRGTMPSDDIEPDALLRTGTVPVEGEEHLPPFTHSRIDKDDHSDKRAA